MDRLRALGQRWPWLGTLLDVQEKVGETNGGSVASSVTLMFFVSLFPLILVISAVIGFLAADDPDVSSDIIDALGLTGAAADTMSDTIANAEQSRRAASIIGLAGLLWSGLGVTAALAQAVRTPWQRKAEGLKAKANGLLWIAGGGVTFVGSIAAGALLNRAPDVVPRAVTSAGLILLGLALELAFFLWTFWIFGDRRPGWRRLLPGAVVGAVGFEVLKVVGTVVVPRMVASSSSLYGSLGVVFALLAWLALFARLIVYASTLNAVLYERSEGTVTIEVQAPRIPGEVPVEADRGGAILDREPAEAAEAG